MNLIKLTNTEGQPILIDTTEVILIENKVKTDHVYGKDIVYVHIFFKNGLEANVIDKFDDIYEKIEQLTQWP